MRLKQVLVLNIEEALVQVLQARGLNDFGLVLVVTVLFGLAGCTPGTLTPTQGKGGGLSAPRSTELTNWAGGVFFPTVSKRDEACGRGYASAQGDSEALGYGVINTLIGPVVVQSVSGSVYNTCRVTAQNLEAQPTGLPLLSAIVYVYNDNFTQGDYYKAYQVAFVALDKDGKELVRLTPTSQELGKRPNPNDPFRWLYFFDPNSFSAAMVQALSQTETFQVLVNRNNGVEVYEMSATTFANFE